MNKLINSFFLSVCFLIQVNGQNATQDLISTWVNNDALRQAHVGIAIHDADQGYQIAGYNSDKLFIPASSLKVLTSLVSLHSFGQEFKYITKLAYEGQIVDSVLYGNVYIIGSGDPSFASKRFSEKATYNEISSLFAYKIKNLGVKKIEGDIIADGSIFDSYPISPSWQWNDIGSGYGSGSWGLNINENEYEIWFNSNKPTGEMTDLMSMVPVIKDLELTNEVFIEHEDGDDNSYIYGDPFSYKKRIVGSIPQRKNPFRIKGSIPDPQKAFAQNLLFELNQRNVEVRNATAHIYKKRNDAALIQIDSFVSVPFIELVRQANYHSLNMYCESFLKTLGYKKGNRGSAIEGINQIKNYLTNRSIDFSGLNMEDGSGLSARNLISPNLLSRFLSSYAKENGFELTASLLPEVGSEGTVRRLLKNSPSKGRIWMKSGSMNQVLTYTGIMKAKSGKWITFSLIANAYTIKASEMRNLMENIIEGIYVTQ
jgi:serine-type D-Ala-D-Ala carboxypeptidase/endopeptidase (penicillin-binding protein 4)